MSKKRLTIPVLAVAFAISASGDIGASQGKEWTPPDETFVQKATDSLFMDPFSTLVERDFVVTDLSQMAAQRVMDFALTFDPNLELMQPEDFNILALPEGSEERKAFLEAFYNEYFARLIGPPGSEMHGMFEALNRGDLDQRGLLFSRIDHHPVTREFNDHESMFRNAVQFIQQYEVELMPEEERALKSVLEERDWVLRAAMNRLTMAIAFPGPVKVQKAFQILEKQYQKVFEAIGFEFTNVQASLDAEPVHGHAYQNLEA